jgi:hypothetical protein
MPTGGCEVQAEQPSDPPVYPVRFKPLLERRCPSGLSHPTRLARTIRRRTAGQLVEPPGWDIPRAYRHWPSAIRRRTKNTLCLWV